MSNEHETTSSMSPSDHLLADFVTKMEGTDVPDSQVHAEFQSFVTKLYAIEGLSNPPSIQAQKSFEGSREDVRPSTSQNFYPGNSKAFRKGYDAIFGKKSESKDDETEKN